MFIYFFFNETATPVIYTYCHTLSLHDALPISCNLVAPGAVDTEFNSALLEKPGWAEGTAKLTPMKRLGVPEDIAGAVMMLVRSEEHTSELQSLMRISYAVFCLKKQK